MVLHRSRNGPPIVVFVILTTLSGIKVDAFRSLSFIKLDTIVRFNLCSSRFEEGSQKASQVETDWK